MTYNEILKRIRPIIVEKLEVAQSEVVPSANIVRDLGADSLDALILQMAVEKHFNIKLYDTDIENVHTVDDAIKLIWQKVDPRGAQKYKFGDKSAQIEVSFGVTGYDRMSCGYLPNDEIYEYLKKLSKQDLSQRYCARYGFFFMGYPYVKNFRQSLIIDACVENENGSSVYGINPLCSARGVGGCFRKIKKGECKDQFVIENIGKVFWPDKYAKQR